MRISRLCMAGGCSLDLRLTVPEMVDDQMSSGFTDKLIFQRSDCASKKLCVDCGTSKTPLWRGGPSGPKSLCNACGIRSRKKRWALLKITKKNDNNDTNMNADKNMKHINVGNTDSNMNGSVCNSTGSSSSNGGGGGRGGNSSDCSRDKLMAMWEMMKPRNVRIEELSEEQEAAVLLMALSHGFSYS